MHMFPCYEVWIIWTMEETQEVKLEKKKSDREKLEDYL